MSTFLRTYSDISPVATLLMAHGAGTVMDSTFMNKLAGALKETGISVARFEFSYMAERRNGGSKRPPPRADRLVGEFQTALQILMSETEGHILLGGKSMGGRVAAMLGGGGSLPARVRGICCFGYPFHPTGKPEAEWRLPPLRDAKRPVLILQGERDPFGSRSELNAAALPDHVSLVYLEDGNHDFGPRGKSPATLDGNIKKAAESTAAFAESL